MNRLTQSRIDIINEQCSSYNRPEHEEGILKKVYGVPTNIKGYVIYCKYAIDSLGDSNSKACKQDIPKNKMKVLDLILTHISPNLTYLQFKGINDLIHSNSYTDMGNDGNSTFWNIDYITLSDLYDFLKMYPQRLQIEASLSWFNAKDATEKSELCNKYFKDPVSYNYTCLTDMDILYIYEEECCVGCSLRYVKDGKVRAFYYQRITKRKKNN